MGYQYRSPLEAFRQTLRMLQDEPGPETREKTELIEYLRERIAEHESLNRAVAR